MSMPLKVQLIRFYRKLKVHKSLGLTFVLGLLLISLLGNSLCYYSVEGREAGQTFLDAMWYSIVSITTIGYGDIAATELWSRVGMFFFIVLFGLGAFTVFLSMLIDWTTSIAMKGKFGMADIVASDHVLIVNFPSESRVKHLIAELKADPGRRESEVVIITDKIDKLPFDMPGVLFVNGSPLSEETYHRAGVTTSNLAVVLATSYDDLNSDAIVASAVSVIDSIRTDIHIVAECLDEKHQVLFKSVNCDSIIHSQKIIDNLLVQEVYDPGVSQMINMITSNVLENTLFTTVVDQSAPDLTYSTLAVALINNGVNLLCVNRGSQSCVTFRDLSSPEKGDKIIYVSPRRLTWSEILKLAGKNQPVT